MGVVYFHVPCEHVHEQKFYQLLTTFLVIHQNVFSILELRVFKLRAQIRITRTPGGGGGGSGVAEAVAAAIPLGGKASPPRGPAKSGGGGGGSGGGDPIAHHNYFTKLTRSCTDSFWIKKGKSLIYTFALSNPWFLLW